MFSSGLWEIWMSGKFMNAVTQGKEVDGQFSKVTMYI